MTRRDHNLLNIKWLCEDMKVSRSGYYAWLGRADARKQKEAQDQADLELILDALRFRQYGKGSRGLQMRLLHMDIVMNRKKIQRLMRKYQIVCPIRKPNPYKRMAKAKKEHAIKPNLVDRQFDVEEPKKVILTDITYLRYARGTFAYLSVMKDSCTKQILAHVLSDSLEVDFVLETINQLLTEHKIPKNQKTLIHSDQGIHYTSMKFQKLLEDKKLRQSMSRRGNCWDNAPQESFFGHMKDELPDLGKVDTFSEVQAIVDDYIDYYNKDRYQWNLAKLSPNQYEDYLKTGEYPLSHLIPTPALPKAL